MEGIAQEIAPVQEVNVNGVRVEPAHWPRVNHVEPKTAVLKTSRPVGEFRTVHVKRVAAAKTCAELSFRNAPTASRGLSTAGDLLLSLSALRLRWFRLL